MSDRRKSILIAGGGVIGLCVAYYASRRGHEVTLIDRGTAQSDRCSNGNAGMVVPSHFVPLAAPASLRAGLAMMRDPRSPLYIQPTLSWDLLTWGWHFWRAANTARVAKAAPALRDLHLASLAAYERLVSEFGNQFGLTQNGLLMLCRTEKALHEEAEVASLAHGLGMPAEVLDREQTAAKEPGVEMNVAGSVYFPKDSHVSPDRLMDFLRARVEQAGVRLIWNAQLEGWRTDGSRVIEARTSRGGFEAEEFVLCAGVWSSAMGRTLGLGLPMQAGKGYSLTLPEPKQLPKACAILTEARVAVTPMGQALRFGGTMEIAGMDESINARRVQQIVRSASEYYPQFAPGDFEGVAAWRGLRPCSPDGMPYIGRTRKYGNVVVATGHGMMGVSLGPITGELVAATVSGELIGFDLKLLDPDRYG